MFIIKYIYKYDRFTLFLKYTDSKNFCFDFVATMKILTVGYCLNHKICVNTVQLH